MVPVDIKYENVLGRLKKTEINKSSGVDNLNPALLKTAPLLLLFHSF